MPHRHVRRFKACVLLAIAPAPLFAGQTAAVGEGSVRPIAEIPFEFGKRVFLSVMINGQAARLAYAPGTGITLDRGFVRKAGLSQLTWRQVGLSGATMIAGPGGTQHEATWLGDVVLKIDTLSFTFSRPVVVPLDSTAAEPSDGRVDGLFGTDILQSWAARFDFPARRLALLDPASVDPSEYLAVLPVRFIKGNPTVRVTMALPDGACHTLTMLVDFGMTDGVRFTTRLVDSLDLARRLTAAPATGTGPREQLTARVPALGLGDLVLTDHPVTLERTSGPPDPLRSWDGVIGLGLLAEYLVVYDPVRGRLLLGKEGK